MSNFEQEDREFREARERIREQLREQPRSPLRSQASPDEALRPGPDDRPPRGAFDEAERRAQEPRVDGGEHLQAANAGAAITAAVRIGSSVPVLGPLLTLLRRLMRPLVQPFLDPYLDRQERFNAEVVRHLNELGNRLEMRFERVSRLADPSRGEAMVDNVLTRYDHLLRQRHAVIFDAIEDELLALQSALEDQSNSAQQRGDEIVARLESELHDFDVRFVHRAQAVDARFDEKDAILEARVRQFTQPNVIDQAELLATRAALGRALEEVTRLRQDTGAPVDEEVEAWSRLRDWLRDADYQAFQDRFRGDAEQITRRMRMHVEHFRGVPGPVADLGCGRGEFLQLLAEAGVRAIGIETNEADVESCVAAGLEAVRGDLFDWLQQQPPSSLGGIFMAQVIEHLRPRDWARVVELASTRLAPGGRLVIETVNPESLYAFSRAYIIDPTHTRPVHPDLLAYLAERQGFSPVEVRFQAHVPADKRVQPLDPESFGGGEAIKQVVERINEQLSNLDTLCFAPQEYALVATKPARG